MLFKFVQLIRPIRYRIEGFLYRLPKNSVNTDKLKELKNIFEGRPLLIVGNGPSLNKTPLDDFQGIPAIGMNKINLLFPRVRWRPSMILSSNPLVVMQNQDFFGSTDIPVFLSWKTRWHMKRKNRKNVHFYLQIITRQFSKDISKGIGAGATITYAAMQFAYYMGANPVILFGVDHSFTAKGPVGKVVVSKQDDPNHFDPNYFGKGKAWQLPDLDFSERAYQRAKEAFGQDGRAIYDATIGGKLDIFPKISVEEAKRLCGPGIGRLTIDTLPITRQVRISKGDFEK